jgi:Nose resistant-to-fluoxetine protein, N-terminal domain
MWLRRHELRLFVFLLLKPWVSANVSDDATLQGLWSSVQVFQHLAASSSAECSNHSATLLQSLNNATFWAVQSKPRSFCYFNYITWLGGKFTERRFFAVLDSSANIPAGVLEGSIYNLGDFDECLSVDNGRIQGQYCLATLTVLGPQMHQVVQGRPVYDAHLKPHPFSNAWHHVQVSRFSFINKSLLFGVELK